MITDILHSPKTTSTLFDSPKTSLRVGPPSSSTVTTLPSRVSSPLLRAASESGVFSSTPSLLVDLLTPLR